MTELRSIRLEPHPANVAADARGSRVPLRFVATGLIAFVAASILLFVGANTVSQPYGWTTPYVLGLTHIIALGFVTSVVMGVLHQFLPASFQSRSANPRTATAIWILYTAGVGTFVIALVTTSHALIAIGASGIGLALFFFFCQMIGIIRAGKKRTLSHGFHVVALVSLCAVVVLGVLLAVGLQLRWFTSPLSLLAPKIVLAVDGWLGMVIVGVSWHTVRILNGSTYAPRHMKSTLLAMTTTVAVAPLTLGFGLPASVRMAAMVPYMLGAFLYCDNVVRTVAARHDSRWGVTPLGQIVGAGLFVVAAVVAIPATGGFLPWPQIAVSTGLLGWAPLLIIANGNRIVPVVVGRYFSGSRPIPLDHSQNGALVMRSAVVFLIMSWLTLEAGFLTESAILVRLSATLLLLGACAFAGCTAVRIVHARRRTHHATPVTR